MALATGSSYAIDAPFASNKAPHNQFHLSSKTPDPSSTMENEILRNSTKRCLDKATKAVAIIEAFVLGVVVHGITSLQGMVALLRISRFKFNMGKSLECFLRGHT